jgi:hypothetical protein
MNQRGQGSIEIMLVVTSVIGLAFYLSVSYLSTQDITTALVIAKNRVTEKLGLHETPAIIENMRFERSAPDTLTIRVFTQPPSAGITDAEKKAIEDEIVAGTVFSVVSIQLNPAS